MARALSALAAAALPAVAGLALSGCKVADGSSGDGGEPDAPYVEETCTPESDDTFCAPYAAAYCAAHFACCDDPALRYATMELCVQRTTCVCTARRSGAPFRDGRVVFDEAAADALLALLESVRTTCPVMDPGALEVDSAFPGTLPAGGDCSPSGTDYSTLFTCAPGHYCYVTDFGDETTPPAAECRPYRAEGASCDVGEECARGLYCAEVPGAGVDDPGVCTAYTAAGEPCQLDAQCASDWCDEDLGTCRATDAQDTYCVDPDGADGGEET